MRIIRLILILIFIFVLRQRGSAEAREVANVFVNYSLLNGDLIHNASGWEVGYTQNLRIERPRPLLGIQGVVSAHHESVPQGHIHVHDLMFGPNFQNGFGHFTLSAHTLAGFAHTGGELGSHNGFASAVGGNVDWDMVMGFSLRLASVDWYQAHVLGSVQHNVRFSAGIVIRLEGFFDRGPPAPPRQTDSQGANGQTSQ